MCAKTITVIHYLTPRCSKHIRLFRSVIVFKIDVILENECTNSKLTEPNSFTESCKRKLGQIYREPHTQITHASPIQSQGAASRKLIIGTRSCVTRSNEKIGRSRTRPDRPELDRPAGRGAHVHRLALEPSRFLNWDHRDTHP